MFAGVLISLAIITVSAALPAVDPVIAKLNPEGRRYDYVMADDGTPHLVDSWIKASDLARQPRYDPDRDNQYHMYTRLNPTVSQPIVENVPVTVTNSNFDPAKRTIVLIHGFLGTIVSAFNTVLVPAFLAAGDVNVIVVDWGAGAHWGLNGIASGRSCGRVMRWIAATTGYNPINFHILGYSVGAHSAGICGRTIGQIGYVTGMDPADRWLSSEMFRSDDALYTEVIHTNAGNIGMEAPLGDVDFYPNGGSNMPGCLTALCDHYRSYYYMGESLTTGGFIGRECASYTDALNHSCDGERRLEMGGLIPKTGATGVFYLTTNAGAPFAQG